MSMQFLRQLPTPEEVKEKYPVSEAARLKKSAADADSSIRISFSHRNEKSDADALISLLEAGISKLARIKK